MSTTKSSTTPGPVPSIEDLREQFAAGILTVAAMGEQHGSESHRSALTTLREAFDHMSTLAAAGPRLAETSPAAQLDPQLPNWGALHDANPLAGETLPDTADRVALHLVGIAFAAEHVSLPRQLGPSLAQTSLSPPCGCICRSRTGGRSHERVDHPRTKRTRRRCAG